MARGDLLRLRVPDFAADGIEIQRHKTAGSSGKKSLYPWTDDLRAAVKDALAARPVDISPRLFCNRTGECYLDEETGRAGGWDSLWRGFMERVMAETDVSSASPSTTKRIYRRKAERVLPLKAKG